MRSVVLFLCLCVVAVASFESLSDASDLSFHHTMMGRFIRKSADECTEAKDEEPMKDFGIVTALMVLVLVFIVGHVLETYHISVLPEAGFAVLAGAAVSLIFYAIESTDKSLSDVISFDKEFFFVWLLPPIIFEAGYNMKRKEFFANIFPTTLFAFVGTVISTFVIGAVVYYSGKGGLCFELSFLESLIFGALVSATDPVSVLAVFQSLGVNINLFSMVFGESVLNDAVALVLYRTLVKFRCEEFSSGSVGIATVTFLEIFILSSVIGIISGLLCALVLRALGLHHHEGQQFTEVAMTAMFAWASYFLAEGFHLSGIVAIMFAGIIMAEYAFENLSRDARDLSRQVYKVAAKIAETFVFVYLGMALFAFQTEADESGAYKLVFWDKANFALAGITILGCLLGRTLNILPCVVVTNLFRTASNPLPKISGAFSFIMWWSGLRGGVAFAIAVANYHDSGKSEESIAVLQATLFVAVFTIFVFGGSITKLALYFNVLESQAEHADHFDNLGLPKRHVHGEDSGNKTLFQKFDGVIRSTVSTKYQQQHDEGVEMQAK